MRREEKQQRERDRDRETERQRDRETERQRDRERETHTEREIKRAITIFVRESRISKKQIRIDSIGKFYEKWSAYTHFPTLRRKKLKDAEVFAPK
jgi:hypothetical protein